MSYNKTWEVAYNRERARGQRRYVPADPTRARLRDLVDARVPLRAMARAAGLSDTAVGQLVGGHHDLVQRQTAERVARLTLADVFEQASGNVPSIGATRRVQALMAIGWRKADLDAAGVPSAQLVTRAGRDWITVAGWRQTRDVYDRLSMMPGPSQACRDRAHAKGYAPPLAWDEDAIDDFRAVPDLGPASRVDVDHVAVDRAVATGRAGMACDTSLRLTQEERVEAVRVLATRGSSDGEIGNAVGVSGRTVLRLRQRHEIDSAKAPRRRDGVGAHTGEPEGTSRLHRAMQLDRAASPLGGSSTKPARAVGA
ncbi:putative PCQ3_96 [Nostocoides japonicum T1-X7]|uniref:Putative PCQ3_96 n=2 Tax=Nostocoides japonicum TaxID=99481 RepID=A0A077M3K0_9MICO|nr:putative PCQ3_96 [Tetrasphaera japonica T1-X7]